MDDGRLLRKRLYSRLEVLTPYMSYPELRPASWPFSLAASTAPAEISQIMAEVDRLADSAQYGWGHTIDFGPFQKEGLLGKSYLKLAGGLDEWGWWPASLDGMRIADVGCFTGGLSLLMAHRGAEVVYAVDEIPEHLAQCTTLARIFGTDTVRPILQSAFRLRENIQPGSLDLVLLSGVLYHLSDMLVGLYAMRELLTAGGLLLIQSSAVDDFAHSYANFGRFCAGRWWQPTGLCLQDMCEFMGFKKPDVRFYDPNNCLARAVPDEAEIPFKRGLNWTFGDIHDARPRSLDSSMLAPAPLDPP
jgi:SAM-dependent methyltransferase